MRRSRASLVLLADWGREMAPQTCWRFRARAAITSSSCNMRTFGHRYQKLEVRFAKKGVECGNRERARKPDDQAIGDAKHAL